MNKIHCRLLRFIIDCDFGFSEKKKKYSGLYKKKILSSVLAQK